MAGQIESFYEAITAGTQKLAKHNKLATKIVLGTVAGKISHGAFNTALKGPRKLSEAMYPTASQNMGSGKYGLNSGGSGADVGLAGLKFQYKKKR